MKNIKEKISKYLGFEPEYVPFLTGSKNEIILQDDGAGVFIREWDIDGVEKPTDEQLNAIEDK